MQNGFLIQNLLFYDFKTVDFAQKSLVSQQKDN